MKWLSIKTIYTVLPIFMVFSLGALAINPRCSQTNAATPILSGCAPDVLTQAHHRRVRPQPVKHSNIQTQKDVVTGLKLKNEKAPDHQFKQSDPEDQEDLVIGLKLHNDQDLDDLIARQSDPNSPDYRQFITPEEFQQRFAPTQADVDKAVADAKENGLTIVEVTPNRLLLHVRGTAKQIEKAFNVKFTKDENAHQNLSSNDRDWSLPASLVPSGLGPKAIATAYNYPNANNTSGKGQLSGEGVTVAIATLYNYDPNDVDRYWHHYSIERTGTVTNVAVNGQTTKIDEETTLDLEQVGSQAPGANVIVYEGGDGSFASWALIYNQIISDNKAAVVMTSYGMCEENPTEVEVGEVGKAEMAVQHMLFKIGTAQGITFFAAAGDGGAYECPNTTSAPQTFSASYPASDPFVIAVGGTALTVNPDGSRQSETVWNQSGGSASSFFAQPAWQTGPGVPQNGKRKDSDLSLNAVGYSEYYQGTWSRSTGTSFSAPATAALWALAVQQNGGRLGYETPALYRLGNSADYGKVFYDVTEGNNGNFSGPGFAGPGFNAGPGWDHPSGWGTPDGTALCNWLSSQKGARKP